MYGVLSHEEKGVHRRAAAAEGPVQLEVFNVAYNVLEMEDLRRCGTEWRTGCTSEGMGPFRAPGAALRPGAVGFDGGRSGEESADVTWTKHWRPSRATSIRRC